MKNNKQTLTSKRSFILFIYAILAIDIAHRIFNHSNTILDWQIVAILGLLTFATVGDRISELIIGKEGITLKQKGSIDRQVVEVKKDAEDIQLINETGDAQCLDSLLKRTESPDRHVWSKLIIYRLTLRALLRQICKAYGMDLVNTSSLTSMIKFMKAKELITAQFERDLDFIRYSTFFFEWGTGNPPTTEEIKRILDIAPQALKNLEYIINYPTGDTSNNPPNPPMP